MLLYTANCKFTQTMKPNTHPWNLAFIELIDEKPEDIKRRNVIFQTGEGRSTSHPIQSVERHRGGLLIEAEGLVLRVIGQAVAGSYDNGQDWIYGGNAEIKFRSKELPPMPVAC